MTKSRLQTNLLLLRRGGFGDSAPASFMSATLDKRRKREVTARRVLGAAVRYCASVRVPPTPVKPPRVAGVMALARCSIRATRIDGSCPMSPGRRECERNAK